MIAMRHPFGTNFDSGVPLASEEDFRLLYVECHNMSRRRLTEWLTAGRAPLVLCGQIGSGKSTLLTKCLDDTHQRPDVEIRFDGDVIRQTAGGFWRATLSAILSAAIEKRADLGFSRLPGELAGLGGGDWNGLLNAMAPRVDSIAHAATRRRIEDALEETPEVPDGTANALLQALQSRIGHPPLILATGLDKYGPNSPAIFSLRNCTRHLSAYRTLFELNAVHLFVTGPWKGLEHVVLTGLPEETLHHLLARRLGQYAPVRESLVPRIASLSGGNPRQALRLLSAFEQQKQHVGPSNGEALQLAVRQVVRDFFAYAEAPAAELLRAVQSAGHLESGLLSLPADKETALLALYGNWVLLQGEPENGTAWPAQVNPIVEEVIRLPVCPEAPDEAALKRHAKQAGMSSAGIGLGVTLTEAERRSARWDLQRVVEYGAPSKLSELLDAVSAGLLSRRRQDRTILVYRNPDLVGPLQEYLFAAANTYEGQLCRHEQVKGGRSEEPVEKILRLLWERNDVLSLQLDGAWTGEQIAALDKQRDKLLSREILLWLPEPEVERFLRGWEHLRDLCQLFVVDDELLAAIPTKEILTELELLDKEHPPEQTPEAVRVGHLKTLLKLLAHPEGG